MGIDENSLDFSTSAQAFATLATETGKEAIAHNLVAQTLVNDISMPLKNLAENQVKERKLVIFYSEKFD